MSIVKVSLFRYSYRVSKTSHFFKIFCFFITAVTVAYFSNIKLKTEVVASSKSSNLVVIKKNITHRQTLTQKPITSQRPTINHKKVAKEVAIKKVAPINPIIKEKQQDKSEEKTLISPNLIPSPSFGINEVPKVNPTFFYYINENHPAATDSDNQYGTKERPRRTIPGTELNPLQAGSVVEVHGKYSASHTSPNDFHGKGTKENPIFIRGKDYASKPYFTKTFDVVGSSYVIFENIEFGDEDGNLSGGNTGSFSVTDKNGTKYDSQHIVLRYSDVHGNLSKEGGTAIAGYGNSIFSNIVFYKNKIHDNGNWQASFDQDVHGTQIGNGANNIWILENEYYHNSGDGVQINGKTSGSISNIYIEKNVAHHNKQVGFWTKKATNVIFSENISYGHLASNSSSGQGMGFQYDPINVTFILNKIYDNKEGIVGDRGMETDYFKNNIKLISNVSDVEYKAFRSE